jgi:3',5'-cyclic AMP phosphodiesterase CpdA
MAPAETARLVEAAGPDAIVFTAGDNAYPNGSAANLANCYDPTWGAFRERTHPAAGNHDWKTAGAAAYLDYFGAAAGESGHTWYAFDAGAWRVIVLDSDCADIIGCGPLSPEGLWLTSELAAHPSRCTMAIWHHPVFSSGPHGDDPAAIPFWNALQRAGAELVVTGHDHDYERFAPQDSRGRASPAGIREFVVGTGGGTLYKFRTVRRNSQVRIAGTFGVLRLELRDDGYSWAFLTAPGGAIADAGVELCH